MPKNKTKFEEFIEDIARNRIYQQESMAFEAAELISGLMEEQKVTKSELAESIGRSKSFITQVLSGNRNMTLHTFAELAFGLGHRVKFSSAPLDSDKESLAVVEKFGNAKTCVAEPNDWFGHGWDVRVKICGDQGPLHVTSSHFSVPLEAWRKSPGSSPKTVQAARHRQCH